MPNERLYTDHPDLYDAIQSDWDYDRDVAFVVDQLDRHDVTGRRLLAVGCGTGEHTRRFVDRGFEVTGVDPYDGMLSVAREKADEHRSTGDDTGTVEFRRGGIQDVELDPDRSYAVAVAIRGVINHLPPAALDVSIRRLADAMADGGLLVLDNSPLPPEGNSPGLDVGRSDDDRVRYVRVARHAPQPDGRLDWRSVTFTPEGEPFVSSRPMTPFDDRRVREALVGAGFEVETTDGYGPGDDRTVFVGVAPS
ncbi:MAG: class I SAM-dependent methyltransferase [Halorubrum sp.]